MCPYFFSCHSSSLIAENVSRYIIVNCEVLVSLPPNQRAWAFFVEFGVLPCVQRSYRVKSIEVKAQRAISVLSVVGTRPEATSTSCS